MRKDERVRKREDPRGSNARSPEREEGGAAQRRCRREGEGGEAQTVLGTEGVLPCGRKCQRGILGLQQERLRAWGSSTLTKTGRTGGGTDFRDNS